MSQAEQRKSPEWRTIQDVREWFRDPRNQHDTKLWIVKWGTFPSIDRSRAHLAETDSFCEAAIHEYNRRKRRGKEDVEAEGDEQ